MQATWGSFARTSFDMSHYNSAKEDICASVPWDGVLPRLGAFQMFWTAANMTGTGGSCPLEGISLGRTNVHAVFLLHKGGIGIQHSFRLCFDHHGHVALIRLPGGECISL